MKSRDSSIAVFAGLFWFLVAIAGLHMPLLWAVLSALLLGAVVNGLLKQFAKQPDRPANREE